MTRWLVTGAGGQLGRELLNLLSDQSDVTGYRHEELDVTDAGAVADAVRGARPDVVVNAAAYTAVDAAERNEPLAFAVNARGPGNLAAACARIGAALVHISTDYVFAGDAHEPYGEADPVAPRGVYGRSKAAGETAVLQSDAVSYVVRTAWVYGGYGPNFVKTMARLERERPTVDVVDDQHGQPTWTRELARGIRALVGRRPAPGVYHCTSSGATTWCGFARAVFEELGADPARVRPTTTDRFPRPAPRPAYSVLADTRWRAAGLPALQDWRAALHEAFARHGDALRGDAPRGDAPRGG